MVKRYDLFEGYDGGDPFGYIDYHEDGDYVSFEDYEELRKQFEDLKKEIEELKKNAVR
jgi:hypothetical protein